MDKRTGVGWGISTDIFSAACVLYELYTGKRLLPITDNFFFLFAYMEKAIGRFDREFAKRYAASHPALFTDTTPPTVNFDDGVARDEGYMEGLVNVRPLFVRISFRSLFNSSYPHFHTRPM